jgi:hypothetical protein
MNSKELTQLTPLRTIEECIAEAKKKAEWERANSREAFAALRNRKDTLPECIMHSAGMHYAL